MVEIPLFPLSKNMVAIIDDCDIGLISSLKWRPLTIPGYYSYAITRILDDTVKHKWPSRRRREVLMHRFILGLSDPAIKVDHKNGNTLDNRRDNLRIATMSQNLANTRIRSDNTTGFKGVVQRGNRFQAEVKGYYLGRYSTAEDAARAYDEKAKALWGEFARLNFPE